MKSILISLFLCFVSSCTNNGSAPQPPAASKFAYVLNVGDNTLSQYGILASGDFSPLTPATVATGAEPTGIVIDDAHSHVYISNRTDNNVSQYAVSTDGSLTSLAAPAATGATPNFMALTPNQKFLFVANYSDNNLTRFTVSPSGTLTSPATVAASSSPASVAFSANGTYAYVVNDAVDTISQYALDPASGSLTPLSPATVASTGCQQAPMRVSKASDGKSYLYVLSCPSQNIEAFAMADNGQLTSIGVYGTGLVPQGFDVRAGYLYVGVAVGSEVALFKVQNNGTLQALTPPTLTTTAVVVDTVGINATGSFVYVLDSASDNILTYSMDSNGQLTRAPNAPITTGSSPRHILLW